MRRLKAVAMGNGLFVWRALDCVFHCNYTSWLFVPKILGLTVAQVCRLPHDMSCWCQLLHAGSHAPKQINRCMLPCPNIPNRSFTTHQH